MTITNIILTKSDRNRTTTKTRNLKNLGIVFIYLFLFYSCSVLPKIIIDYKKSSCTNLDLSIQRDVRQM